jgi:hypothetical protein
MRLGAMGARGGFGSAGVLGAASGPTLNLSASSFPENSALNTVIGTLSVSNGSGSYTYSLTSNPGTLFNISGSDLRVTSTTIAAGSYPVTIEADNGVDTPISRAFLLTATAVSVEELPHFTIVF